MKRKIVECLGGDTPIAIDISSITQNLVIAESQKTDIQGQSQSEIADEVQSLINPSFWKLVLGEVQRGLSAGSHLVVLSKPVEPTLLDPVFSELNISDDASVFLRSAVMSLDGGRTEQRVFALFVFREDEPRLILSSQEPCEKTTVHEHQEAEARPWWKFWLPKEQKNTRAPSIVKNGLALETVLQEGMFKPVQLRIILVKEEDDFLDAIIHDIATLTNFNLFAVDWPGTPPAKKKRLKELFGEGLIHVWSGVLGEDGIRKRLQNVAGEMLKSRAERFLLVGPRSGNILSASSRDGLSPAIYKVELRDHFRQAVSSLKNSSDSYELFEIVSVVAASDRKLSSADAQGLRKCIDKANARMAEEILLTYYNRL